VAYLKHLARHILRITGKLFALVTDRKQREKFTYIEGYGKKSFGRWRLG